MIYFQPPSCPSTPDPFSPNEYIEGEGETFDLRYSVAVDEILLALKQSVKRRNSLTFIRCFLALLVDHVQC